jgi:hypothetical protein
VDRAGAGGSSQTAPAAPASPAAAVSAESARSAARVHNSGQNARAASVAGDKETGSNHDEWGRAQAARAGSSSAVEAAVEARASSGAAAASLAEPRPGSASLRGVSGDGDGESVLFQF